MRGDPERPAPLAVIDPFYTLRRPAGASLAQALDAARAELDRFGVARAGISVDDDPPLATAALARDPERFFARTEADPRRGMGELRRIRRLARELPLAAVTLSPARLFLPLDDKRVWPLLATCVELGLALCPRVGVPREPVPFAPQRPERLAEMLAAFPELCVVMRGDLAPFERLAVALMRRHPNLLHATAGCLPKDLPMELVGFANEDGAHQLLFASEPAPGIPFEHVAKQLPELDLGPFALPRFLCGNAVRAFRLAV